MARLGITYAEK
jgi:hypothetical protein